MGRSTVQPANRAQVAILGLVEGGLGTGRAGISTIAFVLPLLFAFAVSLAVTLMVIRSAKTHGRFSLDHDLSGPQKFHSSASGRYLLLGYHPIKHL